MKLKTYILLIISILLTFALQAQEKNIEFKLLHKNFGSVNARNGDLSYDFVFTNVSDKVAKITRVSAGCGCTVANWTKGEIQPGKTGKVSILLRINRISGYFNKQANVYTNLAKKPIVLSVSGRLSRNYRYDDPFKIRMGNLLADRSSFDFGNQLSLNYNTYREVKFINTTLDTIIFGIKSYPKEFEMSLNRKIVAPGSNCTLRLTPKKGVEKYADSMQLESYTIRNKKDTVNFKIPVIKR